MLGLALRRVLTAQKMSTMFWYWIISIRMLLAQYVPLRPPPFLDRQEYNKPAVMSKEETDTEESGETDLAVLHTDIQSTTEISHIQLIWNQPAWEAYKEAFEDPPRSSAMYAYGTMAAARWGNGEIINRSQCFGSSGFSAEKGLRCSVLKHNWFHLHNLFSLPVVGNTVWQFWVMCFWAAMGSEFVPGVPDEAARWAGGETKPWGKWSVRLKV